VTGSVGACALCGLPTYHPVQGIEGRLYCCPSCKEVDGLLREGGNNISDRGKNQGQILLSGTDKIGENVQNETITFSLSGMWCTSCAWLIEESLQRLPGVNQAEVSFVQREARVSFDPDRTREKRLKTLVRGLGYRAIFPGEKPHDEEEAHANRLLIGGVFAMQVMLLSAMLYIRRIAGLASPDTEWLANIFEIMIFAGSIPLMLVLGLPILRAGLASLIRRRPNMHALIALGAFSAFGLSVRNLFLGLDVYFDTASMLLFLVTLGRWFEIRAQKTGTQAVERLFERIPPVTTRITAEGEQEVPVDQVRAGARLRVHPGDRFPVDGLVAVGEGDVDESLLSGEPRPVHRGPGDRVLAGTVSLDGGFEIIATGVGSESVAGQIGKMLHQAMWTRSPVERLADRLAAIMVPAATLLAAGTFVFWFVRSGPEVGLLHALSVLLIACPCALGLATPLTIWLALGQAAEMGAIVRSTDALEKLAQVKGVCFDKTGTLTHREMNLQAIAPNGQGEESFLTQVAGVEKASEHPLGVAIHRTAQERGIPVSTGSEFQTLPGQGVSAKINGSRLWIGSRRLMAEQGMALSPEMESLAGGWEEEGLSVVYAGKEGHVVGLLGMGESPRVEAEEAIQVLRRSGMQVTVLTGDDQAAGARWEQRLRVPVLAGQKPENKLAFLRNSDGPIAMVGDGINDGPALAAADVGVAMSHGTDVAQAAADVVLVGEDLRVIPKLLSLAKAAKRKVHQNLAWAFFYNLIGLILAMTGLLQPLLAALAMVISSLVVTGNAMRLRNHPL